MILNKPSLLVVFLMTSCGKNSDKSAGSVDPFGEFADKSKQSDSIISHDQPASPIFGVRLHEGRIEFPQETLAVRVERINGMIHKRKIKNAIIHIDENVDSQRIVCENLVIHDPTIGLLIKFSIGVSGLYADTNGRSVRIRKLL